jgi:hypothetical protein
MAMIIPDQGEAVFLANCVNKTAPSNLLLKLYTNDEVIDEDSVIGDLTECAVTGYGEKTLTGANWTVATVIGVTSATFAKQTFTLSASCTIYGWYIVNNAKTALMAGKRFDVPVVIVESGTIDLTPVLQLA